MFPDCVSPRSGAAFTCRSGHRIRHYALCRFAWFLMPRNPGTFRRDQWESNWVGTLKPDAACDKETVSLGKAWLPYILIVGLLTITRIPALGIRQVLTAPNVTIRWSDILDTNIAFSFQPLYVPGLVPFTVVAILAFSIYGLDRETVLNTFTQTFTQMIPATITLIFTVAMVEIYKASGSAVGTASMLMVMATAASNVVGSAWPVFAPLVGVLGAFISGSNSVSNILFSGFQYEVAKTLDISKIITIALQAVGGAAGNMICVHNVVAAYHCGDFRFRRSHNQTKPSTMSYLCFSSRYSWITSYLYSCTQCMVGDSMIEEYTSICFPEIFRLTICEFELC